MGRSGLQPEVIRFSFLQTPHSARKGRVNIGRAVSSLILPASAIERGKGGPERGKTGGLPQPLGCFLFYVFCFKRFKGAGCKHWRGFAGSYPDIALVYPDIALVSLTLP